MRAKIFFFLILIAMGLTVFLCRSMNDATGAKGIEFCPVTASRETMKIVFSGR